MGFADDPDEEQTVTDEIRTAIDAIINRHGGLLGHFVFIGEVAEITDENEADSCVFTTTAKKQKSWHSLGLTHFMAELERENINGGA